MYNYKLSPRSAVITVLCWYNVLRLILTLGFYLPCLCHTIKLVQWTSDMRNFFSFFFFLNRR